MSMFSVTTKNAKQVMARHEEKMSEADGVWATISEIESNVTGNVSKFECAMLNRIFMNAGQDHGENVLPKSCLNKAHGKPADNYHGSNLWPTLARRATRNEHAVKHAPGTQFASHKAMADDHVTGGPITLKECAGLAKHLSSSVRSLDLLPDACGAMASKAIRESK